MELSLRTPATVYEHTHAHKNSIIELYSLGIVAFTATQIAIQNCTHTHQFRQTIAQICEYKQQSQQENLIQKKKNKANAHKHTYSTDVYILLLFVTANCFSSSQYPPVYLILPRSWLLALNLK